MLYKAAGGRNLGRVQAAAGEEVGQTEGGLLTINGNIQPVQERSGLYYETYVDPDGKLKLPSAVPDDCYLVLGDQRTYAEDSRIHGFIRKTDIKGKIFTIIRRRPL